MYLQRVPAILYVTVSLLINGIRSLEVVRSKTATIVCGIAGTYVSPSWDDGTSGTVYIAEGQSSFNPSTTDTGRWSRSSDTKNLIISSIVDSDAGTYRCSITTPTIKSDTTTLTVTNPTDCKCCCDIHKIVWAVISLTLSVGSIVWILFVIIRKGSRARVWLRENLWRQAHFCMIGWVVFSLVYSIMAVILFYHLVCKNDCCEAECDCVCNCWPVYIIIGYVVLVIDVLVNIIGVVAFLRGNDGDAPANQTPMSDAHTTYSNNQNNANQH